MNENIETLEDGDDWASRAAAIVAADDTGMVTSEISLVDVELHEGEVTPNE